MADNKKKKAKKQTKYTPQVIKSICKIIAETGSDVAAYSSVKVGKTTYYRWLKENDEFKLLISKARTEFVTNNGSVFRDLALSRLYITLRDGVRETKKVTVKERNALNRLVTVKETTTEVTKGAPQWAIDRALGMPIAEIDAVKILMEAGWIEEEAIAEIASRGARFNTEVQEILQSCVVQKNAAKNN